MTAKRRSKASTMDIAEKFVEDELYIQNLIYHKGHDLFYIWNENGYYNRIETERDFKKIVSKYVHRRFNDQHNTNGTVNEVYALIKLWCKRERDDEDTHYIAFRDKLLNLRTFKYEQHSKEHFVTHHLPFDTEDMEMEIPTFRHFLNTSLVEKTNKKEPDKELVKLVQEMMGMYLTDNIRASVAFFLYGKDGANGKSVLSHVIQSMVGDDFVSNMTLSQLTDKFNTHQIIGKKINISPEEEDKYAKLNILKALISGDPIKGERKFGESFMFKPQTKYLFSSNKVPTFESIDGGLRRRIKIIPFHKSFTNDPNKDIYLEDKLKAELPGIVAWALRGAQRLKKHKYTFSKSTQVNDMMYEFEDEISSAIKFVRDNYYINDEEFTSTKDLYYSYKTWCEDNGKKHKNKFDLVKDIEGVMTGLEKKFGYNINTMGRNVRARGYNLSPKSFEGENIVKVTDNANLLDQINFK